MLIRILVSLLFSTLSSLALISSTPADQVKLHAGKACAGPSVSQAAVRIQVGAFKELLEAEKERIRLKSHGVDATILYERVRGKGMWYRVYVGRFENAAKARAYAGGLKAQGIIARSWIKPAAPAKSKPPTQASTAPQPSAETVPGPGIAFSEAPAVLPPSEIEKDPSTKRQPYRLAQPAVSTAAKAPRGSEHPAMHKGGSGQRGAAIQEASAGESTEPAFLATFRLSSQTTLRALQRDTAEGEDKLVLPLYEYMQMDYEDAEKGGWSMHAYGWGRSDLADSAYFKKAMDGELLYGYLEYSEPYRSLHFVMGRQQIFAGVTNETVDGLRLAGGLGEVLTVTVFGGVTYASDETSSDTTYGGRIAFHPKPAYELALSFQNTDLDGNPDQRAGADLSINWSDWLTVQGLSSYNLDREDWREHNYSAALRYKEITLEPAYQYFSYRDYFGIGSEENNLFHFLQNSDEQVTIAGADLQYQGAFPFYLTGRYNQYTYNLRQEGAVYYGALMGVNHPKGRQLGGEVGRMDGETDENIYTLYRVYFYWVDPFTLGRSTFISGDAIFQTYDAPVFGKDSAVNYSLSGGARFFDNTMEVKLTGSYSKDPYFDNSLEGLLTFHINY